MYDHGKPRRINKIFSNNTLLFLAILIGALLISTTSAHACSCNYSSVRGFLGPKVGRLPANAAGVAWYTPSGGQPENLKKHLTVEILEMDHFKPLPVKVSSVKGFRDIYVIAPEGEKLKSGATYRFTADEAGQHGRAHQQVLVTIDRENLLAETELKLELGTVKTDKIAVAAAISCSKMRKATQVKIKSKLPLRARQWREQLLYRTIVDGNILWLAMSSICTPIVLGRSLEQIGQDRIYTPCDDGPRPRYILSDILHQRSVFKEIPKGWYFALDGVRSGRHEVSIEAFLPGTGVVLKTRAESVKLSCT